MTTQSHQISLLEAVFDHLVLPPKLPAAPEDDSIPLSWELTNRLIRACGFLESPSSEIPWKSLDASLLLTRDLHRPVLALTLVTAFSTIAQEDSASWLALHVAQQNAAIIIHKHKVTNEVVFEAFEVSASASAVLETNYALLWSFPCRAVAISMDEFTNTSFQETIAEFMEQATEIAFDQFAARAQKGDHMVVERRDTPSPALITEMLMSFLEATGRPFPVYAVQKRVRDDVVLGSSDQPWRRSPYWLMLRVFVQRIMMTWCPNDPRASRICFKLAMCVVLSHLLADCQTIIEPERVLMLQAKLCRRLAKLQTEIAKVPPAVQKTYGEQFFQHRPFFESTVTEAKRVITAIWDEHNKKAARQIPLLPWTADQSDLVLQLSNSGQRLRDLLSVNVAPPERHGILGLPSQAEGTVAQVNKFATQYSSIAMAAKTVMSKLHLSYSSPEDSCLELSEAMLTYMNVVGSHYTDDAILMSQYLLNLFELWVAIDSAAIRACSVLKEYHPVFVPEALDLLCFMTRSDMARLREVQEYIFNRIRNCNSTQLNIFSDPSQKKTFAASYLRVYGKQSGLEAFMERIELASARSEEAKRGQLDLLMLEHQKLSIEIKSGTCVCKRQPDGTMDVRGCKRCYKVRCRWRLKIQVHEAFLPRKQTHKAAILLELKMPGFLAAYRDATWRLRMLGCKNSERGCDAAAVLADFGPLKAFHSKAKLETSLTLASQSKAYLQTHYRELRLPKMAAEVLLPFAPTFAYYDAENSIWANDCRDTPWYHHLLGSWLPEGISDPFAQPALYMDDKEHPSSYEVAANQDECPSGMSHHEFTAYQAAISGAHRRWMVLTLELGSTNLNLSNCWTVKCFRRLALQSGPPDPAAESDALGKVHSIFYNTGFCDSLEHQVRLRLTALQSGRRDLDGISILITCTLRLLHFGPENIKPSIVMLLNEIRSLLSLWISQLRQEVRSTGDGETARKSASSAFWAALLCRQTFTDGTFKETPLRKEGALHFFRASIALSENLIVKLDTVSQDLQQLLAQNMSWACDISERIKMMTFENTSALETIINETWTHAGGSEARSFSDWTFCDGGDWLTSSTTTTKFVSSQTIHYHPIQGHLLIDGKALGRLPLAIRENPGILELFQGKHLLTRASGVAGTEYQILNGTNNHEVHVGLCQGEVVIRAMFSGYLLQYVPRETFRSNTMSDFPSGLVDDCVHWLNLHTGELEMRRKPTIWVPKPSNWVLNVRTQMAVRGRTVVGVMSAKEGTSLVEPQSRIGRIIANIFRHFEDASNLTIFQPLSAVGRLSVEIKRLEMRFFVNRKGLLQSVQLKSEIDPVQDMGTLHGLESKIILRNTANPRRKSVMVPIGPCSWERNGPHVSVRILNEGHYALLTVDPLLGRLSCAPEPTLFYLKALIHALTSFPVPDKLTGRTGTEEAYMCLTAAQSQPWKPLNLLPRGILSTIMSLSPKRVYYPPDRRLYQRVTWDDSLTATIQHEQLAVQAADILQQSQALDMLDGSKSDQSVVEMEQLPSDHLSLRGTLRRQIYERITHPSDRGLLSQASQSHCYHPRGVEFRAKGSARVYCSVKKIRQRSSELPEPQSLHRLLKKWRTFDGFNDSFDTLDIARNLSIETSQAFCPLIQLLSASGYVPYDHMAQLSLALFVFGTQRSAKAIEWLVAIGSRIALRFTKPPEIERFTNFQPDQRLNEPEIERLIVSCQDTYATYLSSGNAGRKRRRAAAPNVQTYNDHIQQDAESIALWLGHEWPDIALTRAQFTDGCDVLRLKVVNVRKAWTTLEPELRRLSQNHALSEYISSTELTVQLLRADSSSGSDSDATESASSAVEPAASSVQSLPLMQEACSFRVPSLTEVIRCCQGETASAARSAHLIGTPAPGGSRQTRVAGISQRPPAISRELSMLLNIVQPFKSSQNVIQQQYGHDLEESIAAMAVSLEPPTAPYLASSQDGIGTQIDNTEQYLHSELFALSQSLTRQNDCHFWFNEGYLWPCESPSSILEQLRLENYKSFSPTLQQSLISFGMLATKLQHLLRIQDAKLTQDDKKLLEELKSAGHSNWNPAHYPEWLLLEIDNNILIRPLQVDVAKAIISPQSSHNSVLQMNMGTGKTSVVMPMAALVLADSTKLCRVIVPKALLLQTAQVLQSRIGGLIGRQVRHIPFSRRSPSNATTLSNYKNMHSKILEMGGLMLCLPAHILSFKLSGLQRLADTRLEEGRQMVAIQNWLDSSCRDILDESDMTLSVYTQLIYPSGDLTTLDGHAYRWLVVEQLLGLVESHSSNLQKAFEGKLVVVQRRQGYPIMHFITKDPEDALNELLVEDICNGRLPQLQIRESGSEKAKDLIKRIIIGDHVSSFEWDMALKSLKDETFGPKILYLVRGLISQRILVVCLKKKWNIQYGLHPERQPIAVPFEAKGTPSQAAEYGHPDTTLILTCLAFYQQGLSKEQLKQGLQGVMQSDDAAAHYDRWICSCTALPPSLRYWNSLDPENDLQVATLWGYLRFDRTVLNHHLNTYIFPRYAKQFSVKLLASGWDIPLLQSADSGQERSLTTGFSGTNDNKRILPQTIQQDDLPKLLYTNAEVLCYLLERRNADCYLTAVAGVRFDEPATLRFLCDKRIRVLIDAGAHILEMENQDVARTWLNIDTKAEGAVYFGANSQIMVRSRFQKDPMPLIASPFANDIENCVVYIDEGHTRGTDLKLPPFAKGAVTLSLGQTKDQTVQAAMRLRQLGTTQSVAFLAPPEVFQGILDLRAAHTPDAVRSFTITSRDVVCWLLEQSCKANEQMMSLYLSQCRDFCRRIDMLWKHPHYATCKPDLEKVLGVIRQEEQQTLQQMYGPRALSEHTVRVPLASQKLQKFAQNVEKMARHGKLSYSSALMEVEQEREIVLEVEHMRENQSRVQHVALAFPGPDTAILSFIGTGRLNTQASSTRPPLLQVFEYVGRTKIGKVYGIEATASRLYVSHEFAHTIDTTHVREKNDIIRPVNWILWSPSSETALIIIPEEAEVIIPLLRKMAKPLVWLLGYTAAVTKSMQSFNCLSYLTVPSWPSHFQVPVWLGIEVGIFSGRLYFEFAEYEPLLAWLAALRDSTGGKTEEPLQFLQEWLTFRRRTEDILYTPVGFVCQGQHLHEGHFFFASTGANATTAAPAAVGTTG